MLNLVKSLIKWISKGGVKISGSRFVLLRGQLALLERALATFMIETHLIDSQFEEISHSIYC